MAENHHHQPNGYLTTTLSSTNPQLSNSQLLQVERSPYHPNLGNFQNLFMANTNRVPANPSFQDSVYDLPPEIDFSRLSLSTPSHHQSLYTSPPPSAYGSTIIGGGDGVGGGGGSVLGNNSFLDSSSVGSGFSPVLYPQSQCTNGDLQRMRVQSAVRGHMGLYMQQPQGYPGFGDDGLESTLDLHRFNLGLNVGTDYDFLEARRLAWRMNRHAVATQTPRITRNVHQSPYDFVHGVPTNLTRNGFRLDNNIYSNGRAITNGVFEPENSSVLMSSLYNNNLVRSQLRPSFSSLDDLRGRILLVAKDQHGCRFLQKKFEEGKPEEIEMIFLEVKDHVRELMVDQFGNYLMQKLFEVCNVEQMTQLLLRVTGDDRHLMAICLDMHGTRAIQKLLEHLTTADQRSLIISVLRRITVTLTKSVYGHHVIQHCLKFYSIEENKHILNVVAENCLDIATDKSGCCVLQQCVSHADGEPRQRLVAEITANALVLSEHPYGNYVVQYLLGLQKPQITTDILAQLAGSYVPLSMNKYGSNVVEKCLRELKEDQTMPIIKEIINSRNFLMFLQDPYGNYVAQSALTIVKGPLRDAMIQLIHIHYPFLHSHPHGKRVLAKLKGTKQHRV